jgi:hypothetical protein
MQEGDTPNYNTTTRFSIWGISLLRRNGLGVPSLRILPGVALAGNAFPDQPARP